MVTQQLLTTSPITGHRDPSLIDPLMDKIFVKINNKNLIIPDPYNKINNTRPLPPTGDWSPNNKDWFPGATVWKLDELPIEIKE